MRYIALVGLVLVAAGAGTNMALAKDADCWNKTGDASLRACTKIIKSKRLFGKHINARHGHNTRINTVFSLQLGLCLHGE